MDQYLAEIRLFATNFAPKGWALCAGQTMPINQNQALFALLGTTYGGNGQTTFALPDLRGRALMHAGQAPGQAQRHTLGETGGAESVTLNAAQLPAHTHSVVAGAGDASTTQPAGALLATAPDAYVRGSGQELLVLDPRSVRPTGGGQAHENRQPFLALNYCIALTGIFPSRN